MSRCTSAFSPERIVRVTPDRRSERRLVDVSMQDIVTAAQITRLALDHDLPDEDGLRTDRKFKDAMLTESQPLHPTNEPIARAIANAMMRRVAASEKVSR